MSNSDLLRRLALIAAWLLAVALTIVGIVMLCNPYVEQWSPMDDGFVTQNLTVPASGLMCLGILILGGLLLLEAFGPRRVYPTEPAAQYATHAEQPEGVSELW